MINKKLKVGDKVQFLDEVGGGVITRLLRDGRLLVKDDDGFEETFELKQLIIPFSEDDDPIQESIEPVQKKESYTSFRKEYLGLALGDIVRPVDDIGEGVIKSISENGHYTVVLSDSLVMEYQRKEIVKVHNDEGRKVAESIDQVGSILKEIDKEKVKKIVKVKREISVWEIDLHVHEITEETDRLGPAALLQIQLDHFEMKLKEAMEQRVKKVVFIHGRGKGKLRAEIRARLKRYPNCEFLDGNYQRYGQGATEVIIWNV